MLASTTADAQYSEDAIDDPLGGELLGSPGTDARTVKMLCLMEGLDEVNEGRRIHLTAHALPAGGEAVDGVAGQSALDEGGPGTDADGGTAGQQYISWSASGPWSSSAK